VPLEDRILNQLAVVGEWLRSARVPLLFAGAALFLLGAWWSFTQLRLSAADFELRYLALLLLMMPISLLYSGIGLKIIARSGGVNIPLGQATMVACHASLAEALPIPGGAIVRSGALMARGIGLVRSAALVTANAVLWIALSAVGAGLAILPYSTLGAFALFVMGGAGVAGILAWLAWKASPRIAFDSLVHRIAGVLLLSLRLFLAFQSIGVALPYVMAFPVTLATIAGSAASITPAGLGISEMLAALIANAVQLVPAAAFLAVGLDRLLFLMMNGLVALANIARRSPKAAS
jgi:uncharacterized membrane protein YbhN (UPF0104 family)